MIGLMLRGFFLVGIISWYSHGVFKLINDYFRSEYKNYLADEVKRNKLLMPNEQDNRAEIKDQTPVPPVPPPASILAIDEHTSKSLAGKCIEASCIDNRGELRVVDGSSSNVESAEVNYWLNRKKRNDYDGENDDAHCHAKEKKKCEDN